MGLLAKPENRLRRQFEADALPHLDALYGNALHLTRSAADAEDLVQDTMVKAFRFYDHFEQGTNLKAWLFRIQYNTFVNLYRRAGKQSAATDSNNWSNLAGDFIGQESLRALIEPERDALRPLVAQEISRAFQDLSREYRSVLLLADVEEYSYREIAEIVGCPLGTVMSRLHRARRALRKALLERAGEMKPPAAGDAGAVSVQASDRVAAKAPEKPSAPAGPARSVLDVHDEPARGRWGDSKRIAPGTAPVFRDGLAAVVSDSNHPPERIPGADTAEGGEEPVSLDDFRRHRSRG